MSGRKCWILSQESQEPGVRVHTLCGVRPGQWPLSGPFSCPVRGPLAPAASRAAGRPCRRDCPALCRLEQAGLGAARLTSSPGGISTPCPRPVSWKELPSADCCPDPPPTQHSRFSRKGLLSIFLVCFLFPPQYQGWLFSCSVVSDSVTPWTIARQAPLFMGFPRQGYWSGLPFPSPEDFPDSGIEPMSPVLAGGFLTAEPPGKPELDFATS